MANPHPKPSRRSHLVRVFDHLTDDERIEKACELLAAGVLRLAEKRGLLEHQKQKSEAPVLNPEKNNLAPTPDRSILRIKVPKKNLILEKTL